MSSSSASDDRQPLLPQHQITKPGPKPSAHVNHSSSSRLSTTRISFPSSTSSALSPNDGHDPFPVPIDDSDLERGRGGGSGGRHRAWEGSPLTSTQTKTERKPGLPKLSRQCLWS
ncbi:hypothetical protein I317_07488 [Kwoniella heveanensis CBS 569]|nr:hypothetical protein I317_07488 [Kwoniella heveanensis CBS 569]